MSSTTFVSFADLDQTLQRQALNEYRYIEVEYSNWHDSVKEDFAELVAGYGIDVSEVVFDFRNASFKGRVVNTEKFLLHLNIDLDKKSERLCKFAIQECGVSFEHSSHSYCQSFSFEWENPSINYGKGKTHYQYVENVLSRLERAIEDFSLDLAYTLLKAFETEYEYLTSDEAVREYIDANGLLFDEETGEAFSG